MNGPSLPLGWTTLRTATAGGLPSTRIEGTKGADMNKTATAIDLFAGCGGFSIGLIAAGYRVLGGFDSYPRCIWTYNHNHEAHGSKGILADLSNTPSTKPRRGVPPISTGAAILSALGTESVDLVCGGPPCQSFSIRGKRKGLDDVRGTLVFDFARLIGELQPRAFIFENVANLASGPMRAVLDELLARFAEAGYQCSWDVLVASDFGVAQNRKRLFIVGSRELRLRFPPATHSADPQRGKYKHLSASDAIGDLPDVHADAAALVPNHEDTHHLEPMLEAFRNLQPGKRDPKSHHDRLHPDRPGYTLRAGVGNFSPLRPIHYQYDRVVSVRESARLQGFPDSFVWPPNVPRLQQYRQVGNSVPPPLAMAVAAAVGRQIGLRLAPVAMDFPAQERAALWDDLLPTHGRSTQLTFFDSECPSPTR